MNRPLLAAFAALALCGSAAQAMAQTAPAAAAASATSLDVKLRGVKAGKGQVVVMLFSDEASYDAGKPVQGQKLDATGEPMTVSFAGLAPGRYAVKAIYDINKNGAFDKGTDGIGFSNHFTFSDYSQNPTFSEISFAVKAGANTQQITFAVVPE